jgi:hypothetical protein
VFVGDHQIFATIDMWFFFVTYLQQHTIDNSAARAMYNAKKTYKRIQLPIKQREREKYRYVTLSSVSHLMRSHPIQGLEFACQDERLSPHASLTASKESPAENNRS